MKTRALLLSILGIVALMPVGLHAQERETETKLGGWYAMKFSTVEEPGKPKSWRIGVSDTHAINFVLMSGDKVENLKELRAKIDELIAELEKK